jgi:hypothetical protein
MEPEKDIFDKWREDKESQHWITKKFDSIRLWWKFDGRYIHSNIIEGVKNVWYWLPIIWKDRNWDSSFIFTIIKHKLEAQANCIGTREIHTRAKRDAEVMITCTRLIDKVTDEYYGMEYMDYYKDKHWFTSTEIDGYSKLNSKTLYENFDVYFAKYPLIYKRVMNDEGVFNREGREDDKHIIAMNIAHINHDRARKLLFKLMEQNIERWWD